jgi:hypothetical protein
MPALLDDEPLHVLHRKPALFLTVALQPYHHLRSFENPRKESRKMTVLWATVQRLRDDLLSHVDSLCKCQHETSSHPTHLRTSTVSRYHPSWITRRHMVHPRVFSQEGRVVWTFHELQQICTTQPLLSSPLPTRHQRSQEER